MHSGASSCKVLKVMVNNLNWQRITTGSRCSCLKIEVMCALGVVFFAQHALLHYVPVEVYKVMEFNGIPTKIQ